MADKLSELEHIILKELERREDELTKEKEFLVIDGYTPRQIMGDASYNRIRGKIDSLEFILEKFKQL